MLWLYWLFSGYGLRASRALVAFALIVPLFAIGFWLWGLDLDHGQRLSYWIALLRSLESATSLLRPSPPGFTHIGQVFDAFLRRIGATLLAHGRSRPLPGTAESQPANRPVRANDLLEPTAAVRPAGCMSD